MHEENKPFLVAAIVFCAATLLLFTILLVLNACTVSMTMNHSEGGTTALDEDQTTTANPSTTVPVSLTGAK